ncbi:Sulfotransferase family protein [Alteromonadaceae bacterium Bs31]|nr:Sulfotransferase family protein [Alteromonadaceae bacterium Bs31]
MTVLSRGHSIINNIHQVSAWSVRKSWPIQRSLINHSLNNASPKGPPIALLGNGRSGTSWVGRTLGYAPRVAYYREPCHPDISRVKDDSVWSRFVAPDEDDAYFRWCLDRAFTGKFIDQASFSLKSLALRKEKNYRVIVKEVACYLSAEWLARVWAPQVLIIIRHPCPSIASVGRLAIQEQERRRLGELIENPRLRDSYLSHLGTHLESLKTPIEVSSGIWAIKNYVVNQVAKKYPEWIWIRYEDICLDPLIQFRALYKKLGLEWTDDVQARIVETTTRPADKNRNARVSSNQVNKWRSMMTSIEIESVRKAIEPFELPFYQDISNWN